MEKKTRASLWFLGALLARIGHACVPLPGGCKLNKGPRKIDMHLCVMEKMGAKITLTDDSVIAIAPENGLKGIEFTFPQISVGATINALLAATLANGKTILSNCASEPEVTDLCSLLRKMGANIKGDGSKEISITGVSKLDSANHQIIGDRIEAITYLIAAGITNGEITLSGISDDLILDAKNQLKDAGMEIVTDETGIKAYRKGEIIATNVITNPHPHFPTDAQALIMSLLCFAKGTSYITENVYDTQVFTRS